MGYKTSPYLRPKVHLVEEGMYWCFMVTVSSSRMGLKGCDFSGTIQVQKSLNNEYGSFNAWVLFL